MVIVGLGVLPENDDTFDVDEKRFPSEASQDESWGSLEGFWRVLHPVGCFS